MKKLIIALSLMLFMSCTRTVYTHQDYMNNITTRNEVINRFGYPTNKSFDGKTEIWNYDLGAGVIGSSFTPGNTIYTSYSRNINFVIEGQYVKSWNSQGVDFKKEETDSGKTTGAVIGSIIGTTIFILIMGALIG